MEKRLLELNGKFKVLNLTLNKIDLAARDKPALMRCERSFVKKTSEIYALKEEIEELKFINNESEEDVRLWGEEVELKLSKAAMKVDAVKGVLADIDSEEIRAKRDQDEIQRREAIESENRKKLEIEKAKLKLKRAHKEEERRRDFKHQERILKQQLDFQRAMGSTGKETSKQFRKKNMPENQLQLFVNEVEGKTIVYKIHKDAKIKDLIRKISERTGIPTDQIRLLYSTKQLELDKYLSDYHIQNNSTLYIYLRLYGGSMDDNVKQLDDDVEFTLEPDMITWDDDPDNQRAKMPCGHAIGLESLTAYCRSLLSAGKFRFLCPYLGPSGDNYCGQEWDFIDVRRFAVLTDSFSSGSFNTKCTVAEIQKQIPGCE